MPVQSDWLILAVLQPDNLSQGCPQGKTQWPRDDGSVALGCEHAVDAIKGEDSSNLMSLAGQILRVVLE